MPPPVMRGSVHHALAGEPEHEGRVDRRRLEELVDERRRNGGGIRSRA